MPIRIVAHATVECDYRLRRLCWGTIARFDFQSAAFTDLGAAVSACEGAIMRATHSALKDGWHLEDGHWMCPICRAAEKGQM